MRIQHGVLITAVFLLIGLAACGKRETTQVVGTPPATVHPDLSGIPEILPPPEMPSADGAWPPENEGGTVNGYRFQGDNTFSSLLADGMVDTPALAKIQVATAKLDETHTKKLLAGLISKKAYPVSTCYDPHHIFIFRDSNGTMTHAAEVCFSCLAVKMLPAGGLEMRQQDFRVLAFLCQELGLWDEKQSVGDYTASLRNTGVTLEQDEPQTSSEEE